LAATELSLSSETLQQHYERQYAQNEGRPTRQQTDATYETWKKYKMQVSGKRKEQEQTSAAVFPFLNASFPTDVDNDVLPYPKQKEKKVKNRKKIVVRITLY